MDYYPHSKGKKPTIRLDTGNSVPRLSIEALSGQGSSIYQEGDSTTLGWVGKKGACPATACSDDFSLHPL